MLFTANGVFGMIFQLLVFPPVARRFGVLRCLRICFVFYPLLYLITPYTALFPTTAAKETSMFVVMLVRAGLSSFAFPCSTILLTNSASSLRTLGTLNGIATSVAAICRAAGPALTGVIFSAGVKLGYVIMPFWVLSGISALAVVPAFLLVEGEGFGDDGDADPDAGPETESGEDEERPKSRRGVAKNDVEEEESEYGAPGPLLSRTPTVSTVSLGADSDAVVDNDDESGSEDERLYPHMRHEHTFDPSSSSPSRSQQAHGRRSSRRRSSVPIGGGIGFRRLSSNLGQSMSGFATGTSWA